MGAVEGVKGSLSEALAAPVRAMSAGDPDTAPAATRHAADPRLPDEKKGTRGCKLGCH